MYQNEIVIVDDTAYPLSAYPSLFVEKVGDFLGGDPVSHIEAFGHTPDDCPHDTVPLHDGLHFLNGKPIADRWISLGETCDHIDLDEHGQLEVWGDDGLAILGAWSWCELFATGTWHIRANETCAECCSFELQVRFDLPTDEAAFLAANPGVGA